MQLLAEDGAKFHGQIDKPEGQFRATCWAEHNLLHEVRTEQPENRMFDSEDAARAWVNANALARKFAKITWHKSL